MDSGNASTSNSSNSSGGGYASAAGLIVGPIITAFSNRANRKAQEKANKQNWENQMAMWNMTNEYNTPLNQRLRMEQAGFNPHAHAGSMVNTASNQNLPDSKPYIPDPSSYTQAGQAMAQTFENALTQDAMRTKAYAEADKTDAQGKLTKEQAYQLEQNRTTNIALRQQQLHNQVLDGIKRDMFNSQMPQIHQQRMAESMQRIANLSAVYSNEQIKGELMREELELRKMGINPNTDGFFIRFLTQMFGANNVKSYFNDSWH